MTEACDVTTYDSGLSGLIGGGVCYGISCFGLEIFSVSMIIATMQCCGNCLVHILCVVLSVGGLNERL